MDETIDMIFFAMKIDSSLWYLAYTTKRMIKKTKLTKAISTKLRRTVARKRIFASCLGRLDSLFSNNCQSDISRLKDATAIMAIPKLSGIVLRLEVAIVGLVSFVVTFAHEQFALPCFLSSKTISIISTTSKRSIAIWQESLDTRSLCSSERSKSLALCNNNSNRGGVTHRTPFRTLGPRNFSLSSLSPIVPNKIPMFTTRVITYETQT